MPITRAYGQASQLGNTPAASNPILNSAFQVWQRGTSIAGANSTSLYGPDRWQCFRTGATFTRQTTSDSTNLPFIQYCVRVQRNSGTSGVDSIYLAQGFESINSVPYLGKTVTLSFYARRGANFSAASNNLSVRLNSGTGTDQNILNGFTGEVLAVSSTATLTTTWQRFTFTGTFSSTATQIGMYFYYDPTGTAGANDYFEITGIQLDIGSVALPFRTYAATLAGELAACQRYYFRNTANATDIYAYFGQGFTNTTTNARMLINVPVTMRVKPTSVDFANLGIQEQFAGTIFAVSAISIGGDGGGPNPVFINATCATASGTKYSVILSNGSSTGYLGFSAEL